MWEIKNDKKKHLNFIYKKNAKIKLNSLNVGNLKIWKLWDIKFYIFKFKNTIFFLNYLIFIKFRKLKKNHSLGIHYIFFIWVIETKFNLYKKWIIQKYNLKT